MTKVYLKDLEPAEVIDRLHEGQIVYYTDTKGKRFQYQMYRGVLWRYNRDTHEVDGYNRSIYSTGEAYFETEGTLYVRVKHHYRTRHGKTVYITGKKGIWCEGTMFLEDSSIDYSWTDKGEFYPDSVDPRDLVVELD